MFPKTKGIIWWGLYIEYNILLQNLGCIGKSSMSQERKKNPLSKPHISYYFQWNYQEKLNMYFLNKGNEGSQVKTFDLGLLKAKKNFHSDGQFFWIRSTDDLAKP